MQPPSSGFGEDQVAATPRGAPSSLRADAVAAAAISLFLHVVPVAALVLAPSSMIYGVSTTPSDEVSIETIVSVILTEAQITDDDKPPAAAVEQAASLPSPPTPQVEIPKDQPVEKVVREPEKPKDPVQDPKDRQDGQPPKLAALTTPEPADIVPPEPSEAPKPEAREQAPVKPPEQPAPPPLSERPAQAPSVESRGPAPGAPGSQRAAASRGDLLAYAGLIRGRLAKRKPRIRGMKGSVVVAFGVDGSGAVSFASVDKPSGIPALDEVAMKVVREAGPFPPPPDGRAHSFVLPFEFR